MAKKNFDLYPGDNEAHQFWEGEDDEFVIFKNHGEKHWLAFHKLLTVEDPAATREAQKKRPSVISVSLSAPSAQKMAKKLEERFEIKINLDRSKRWMPNPDPNAKRMKLS